MFKLSGVIKKQINQKNEISNSKLFHIDNGDCAIVLFLIELLLVFLTIIKNKIY